MERSEAASDGRDGVEPGAGFLRLTMGVPRPEAAKEKV